jgi:DNA-binding response OmpR family regulator
MDIILLLMAKTENSRLLRELLAEYYRVEICENLIRLNEYFDLLIIDGLTFKQGQNLIQERINREKPLFLPVLLLTTRQDVTMSTAKLWEIVHDIVTIPIAKQELLARVENLLRSRRLSLELDKTYSNLLESREQIEKLEHELEQLNQMFPPEK